MIVSQSNSFFVTKIIGDESTANQILTECVRIDMPIKNIIDFRRHDFRNIFFDKIYGTVLADYTAA